MNNPKNSFKIQRQRDFDILMYLFYGIATSRRIKHDIFVKKYKTSLKSQVCPKRLKKLLDRGLIKKEDYNFETIYAISPRGIKKICRELNINPNLAQNVFPAFRYYRKQLILADVVRSIHAEIDTEKYTIRYMLVKSLYKGCKNLEAIDKNFPDIQIRVLPPSQCALTVDIMLDKGDRPPTLKKIDTQNEIVLILVNDSKRLYFLREYMSTNYQTASIGLALLSDFLRDGLSNVFWDCPCSSLKLKWHPEPVPETKSLSQFLINLFKWI
ncbi:MAG: hypothetical protein WC539_07485 [Nitrospirota bacterium]